ncbi:MAG TPA: hypothetical protein VFN26_09870 [Candidatus Acidoferrum sp.]|nr:hypothetical protein [Candidatus Acidoferrum sp.]
MNEFNTWLQSNWYEMGNLLAEFVFLIAGIGFARKILRTLRASQEQFGALLKLTLSSDELSQRAKSAATAQHSSSTVAGEQPSPYVMAEWPTASESPELTLQGGQRPYSAVRGLVQWLNTPMKSHGFLSWRRILHWLQAPAGSQHGHA